MSAAWSLWRKADIEQAAHDLRQPQQRAPVGTTGGYFLFSGCLLFNRLCFFSFYIDDPNSSPQSP
jgi:hypothetical protein